MIYKQSLLELSGVFFNIYLKNYIPGMLHIIYQLCLSIVFEVGGGYQLPVLEFCPHALPWGGHMSWRNKSKVDAWISKPWFCPKVRAPRSLHRTEAGLRKEKVSHQARDNINTSLCKYCIRVFLVMFKIVYSKLNDDIWRPQLI